MSRGIYDKKKQGVCQERKNETWIATDKGIERQNEIGSISRLELNTKGMKFRTADVVGKTDVNVHNFIT